MESTNGWSEYKRQVMSDIADLKQSVGDVYGKVAILDTISLRIQVIEDYIQEERQRRQSNLQQERKRAAEEQKAIRASRTALISSVISAGSAVVVAMMYILAM